MTYTGLINALDRGGQWQLAMQAFSRMRQSGCRPDGIVCSTLIEALWGTGLQVAQRLAVQQYRTACAEGLLPAPAMPSGPASDLAPAPEIRDPSDTPSSPLAGAATPHVVPPTAAVDVSLASLSPGMTMMVLCCWLADIRRAVLRDGPRSISGFLLTVNLGKSPSTAPLTASLEGAGGGGSSGGGGSPGGASTSRGWVGASGARSPLQRTRSSGLPASSSSSSAAAAEHPGFVGGVWGTVQAWLQCHRSPFKLVIASAALHPVGASAPSGSPSEVNQRPSSPASSGGGGGGGSGSRLEADGIQLAEWLSTEALQVLLEPYYASDAKQATPSSAELYTQHPQQPMIPGRPFPGSPAPAGYGVQPYYGAWSGAPIQALAQNDDSGRDMMLEAWCRDAHSHAQR